MRGTVQIDPGNATPIWRQIEEEVRRLVASGALAPGEPAPSVRELARELRINPATVAKAYQRLVDAGVLVVRRGEGTYVADAPPPMPAEEKLKVLHDGAIRYAALGLTIGVSRDEAVAELGAVWAAFAQRAKGGTR
ncbi:MAG: GntR family transcriptional regulator [Acidobacteriota bacterium]